MVRFAVVWRLSSPGARTPWQGDTGLFVRRLAPAACLCERVCVCVCVLNLSVKSTDTGVYCNQSGPESVRAPLPLLAPRLSFHWQHLRGFSWIPPLTLEDVDY